MKTLKELTEEIILERIHHFGGNKAMAARSLGIARRTIHRLIEAYPDRFGSIAGQPSTKYPITYTTREG